MKKILIATDGSPGGFEAVREGVSLASETAAAVTIVAVHHPPLPIYGDASWQRAVTEELGRLRPALKHAVQYAEEHGVTAEHELIEGDPAHEVVQLARARDVDLIVVGSRGLGAMASAVFGSVSRRIVRDADRPVLVAKARDAEPGRDRHAAEVTPASTAR
jgi:nucleotide-binding universal stress UspA family protein